jgi:hypothetical protein
MSVTPTPEQVSTAETALESGQIMLLDAYVGTGKTETLRLMAQHNPDKSVLYLSFNRQTEEKAEARFPQNTACRTIHSFAFRAVGGTYKNMLGSPTPWDVIREFSVRKSYIAVLAQEWVESANAEEINLLYVAMTRASQEIEYPKSLVDWLEQHELQGAAIVGV